MKTAVPSLTRPNFSNKAHTRDEWERRIDNYDRTIRRRNKRFRKHVVRIDHHAVGLISSDHSIPYSFLNGLDPVAD